MSCCNDHMPVLRRYKELFLQYAIIYETTCLRIPFNITMVSLWDVDSKNGCVHRIVHWYPYCSVNSHMCYVESLTVKMVWWLCANRQFSTHLNTAACPSFNINYPPMRTLLCPGDIITYTCAFSSSSSSVATRWTGSGFQCSTPGVAPNTIALSQDQGASLNAVPVSCGNLSAAMINISGTCYTSVLTIPTPQYFNGTKITCRDSSDNNMLIGNGTLNIQLACK